MNPNPMLGTIGRPKNYHFTDLCPIVDDIKKNQSQLERYVWDHTSPVARALQTCKRTLGLENRIIPITHVIGMQRASVERYNTITKTIKLKATLQEQELAKKITGYLQQVKQEAKTKPSQSAQIDDVLELYSLEKPTKDVIDKRRNRLNSLHQNHLYTVREQLLNTSITYALEVEQLISHTKHHAQVLHEYGQSYLRFIDDTLEPLLFVGASSFVLDNLKQSMGTLQTLAQSITQETMAAVSSNARLAPTNYHEQFTPQTQAIGQTYTRTLPSSNTNSRLDSSI
ncbi:MAG: hypothetical protein ACMXYF_02045 [Candidatus Woesearchaeota archaeon]